MRSRIFPRPAPNANDHAPKSQTLLLQKGVSAAEVVANGEWGDEAMMRTYVEVLNPFVADAHNLTDLMYDVGVSPTQAERISGKSSVQAEQISGESASIETMVSTVQELADIVRAQQASTAAPPTEANASSGATIVVEQARGATSR